MKTLNTTRASTTDTPVVIIRPTRGLRFLDVREIWHYRELLYFLTWRDIKVRYKQTAIGVTWAILQPLALMLVFTLFFGKLAKIPSEGLPYPIFAYTALLPWQLFSRAISESTNSLITNQRLITKIYFPRIIVPLSTILSALLDFIIASGMLIILIVIYGIRPGWETIFLPFFTLLLLMTALGVGFWLSAINVEYRDVQYVIPFLNQFWLFLTPVVYPSTLVPERWKVIYGLNPMVGVIEGFRWSLLGKGSGPSQLLFISALVGVLLFVTGIIWFRYREKSFIDMMG